MSRLSVSLLCCLALGLVSLESGSSGPNGPQSLPPVSSAPSAVRASGERLPIDAEVQRAIDYFQARSVPLTGAEIESVALTIVELSRARGLDPELVMAVIHIESRGHPFAVSPVGAMGMMQVMPATGEELAARLGIRWMGPATLFDPEVNVRMGVAYLDELARRYGSVPTALAAYNWGPGHIDGRLRRGVALPVGYSESVLERL